MDPEFSILANFDKFIKLLLDNDIFDDQTLSNLTTCNENKSTLMQIIANIESRDQTEIDKFAEIMRRSELATPDLLEPTDQIDSSLTDLTKLITIRFKDLLSSPKACGEELVVKASKKIKSKKDVYPMTARPRGFCVIIDNQLFDGNHLPFRTGSRADADRLAIVFSQLDFDVLRFTNKTSTQIETLLKRTIAQNEELVKHDALAIVILTHGLKDEIYGTDGLTLSVDSILEYFNNQNCPLLRNKPKMFFLSACRGERIDSGIQTPDLRFYGKNALAMPTPMSGNHLPTWSDIFVYYSTINGYASLRNISTGSWFGYELAHSLAEFAHEEHLHDLVTIKVGERLQERVSQVNGDSAKQAIETQTKGRVKKLYFNPGLSVLEKN